MTAFNSKSGGFFKTTVGRVQTPTLAIVVEREQKIRKFVPRDYWEVIGTFDAAAGEYTGRWFDEKFVQGRRKDGDDQLKPERVLGQSQAPKPSATNAWANPASSPRKASRRTPLSPLLYDLTSLQREANSRFGFSAKTTLGLAQALYERHKVLTYPRTDSRALPEDYIGTVKQTSSGDAWATPHYAHASPTRFLKSDWVKPNKRIFNNAKVSDHFAIIPTTQAPKGLSEPEQKLYDMVAKRFLAVFYPAAEFLVTTRITRVEGEPFKSAARCWSTPGWLAVYGKEAQDEDRREPRAGAAERNGQDQRHRGETNQSPNRRRASRKRRCSARWKARASWSRTKNCARRCARRASARRPRARPSSKD